MHNATVPTVRRLASSVSNRVTDIGGLHVGLLLAIAILAIGFANMGDSMRLGAVLIAAMVAATGGLVFDLSR